MIKGGSLIFILKAVALGTSIAAIIVLILNSFPQGKALLTNPNPLEQVLFLLAISTCCMALVGIIKK